MAFGGKVRGSEERTVPPAPAAAPPSGGGGLTAFIDQGSTFEGKLSFKDTVRIDGRFEGEITSQNTLIVGESGQVHANIESETVIVSGEVRGGILARSQIHLHKSARVFGDVQTQALIVEGGAQLNGRVEMGETKASRPGEKKAPGTFLPRLLT